LLVTTPVLFSGHFSFGEPPRGGCNGTTRTDVAPRDMLAITDGLAPLYVLAQPEISAHSLVASGWASTAALVFDGEELRSASAALVLAPTDMLAPTDLLAPLDVLAQPGVSTSLGVVLAPPLRAPVAPPSL
jgi:hypothetical protein